MVPAMGTVNGMSARPHLVWDWNGTLLDDLPLVIAATNAAFESVGGPAVTPEEHRRGFRRPIADYYAEVLRRPVTQTEFALLNELFHETYQAGLPCALTADAIDALRSWHGSQSLLSMWFHHQLLPEVEAHGLTGHFTRIDGMPLPLPGIIDHKGPYLAKHLAALGIDGQRVVLIGDTVDDAHAAASVGAECILYTGGFTGPAQLRATGAPVVDSLLEAVLLAGDHR
jgi:phosphoglycolate phosphatase-like HAD superfamily hydrolase